MRLHLTAAAGTGTKCEHGRHNSPLSRTSRIFASSARGCPHYNESLEIEFLNIIGKVQCSFSNSVDGAPDTYCQKRTFDLTFCITLLNMKTVRSCGRQKLQRICLSRQQRTKAKGHFRNYPIATSPTPGGCWAGHQTLIEVFRKIPAFAGDPA